MLALLFFHTEFCLYVLQALEPKLASQNKEAQKKGTSRRNRAAEVHNLSERVGTLHFSGGKMKFWEFLFISELFY